MRNQKYEVLKQDFLKQGTGRNEKCKIERTIAEIAIYLLQKRSPKEIPGRSSFNNQKIQKTTLLTVV